MDMNKPSLEYGSAIMASLDEKLKESVISVMPVSLLVFALSLTPWVDISSRELFVFIVAAFLLVLGIGLFNLGADMAMTPMGQSSVFRSCCWVSAFWFMHTRRSFRNGPSRRRQAPKRRRKRTTPSPCTHNISCSLSEALNGIKEPPLS